MLVEVAPEGSEEEVTLTVIEPLKVPAAVGAAEQTHEDDGDDSGDQAESSEPSDDSASEPPEADEEEGS